MLLKIAEMGGLGKLLALVKGQILADSTEASAEFETSMENSEKSGTSESQRQGKSLGKRHRYEMISKVVGKQVLPWNVKRNT